MPLAARLTVRPYYSHAGITIYHGDCREILPSLAGQARLIFTSPPYNLGNTTGGGFPDRFGHFRKSSGLAGRGGLGGKWRAAVALASGYGAYDDNMKHEDYVAWQHEVLRLCWCGLTDDGAIYYNHKPRILDGELITPFEYLPPELLPYRRQVVIWKRSGGINFTQTAYLPMHEWIVILARRAFRLRDKSASGVGDVWSIHQETDSGHPAPFPSALPRMALETTLPGLVVDPFMGSGTTLRAAKDLGRPAVGIDVEERWCELAAERMGQEILDLRGVPD